MGISRTWSAAALRFLSSLLSDVLCRMGHVVSSPRRTGSRLEFRQQPPLLVVAVITAGIGDRSVFAYGAVASQESTSGWRSVNWRYLSSTFTHTMTMEASRRRRALTGLDLVTAAILGCVERHVGALEQGLRGVLGSGLG